MSSVSHSGRSNGVRLHSANAQTMKIIKVPMHEIGLSQEEINKQTIKFEKAGIKVVDVIKVEDVLKVINKLQMDTQKLGLWIAESYLIKLKEMLK